MKPVYNDTLGASKMCCYNQLVVVPRTYSTETIESVPVMCVVVKRLMLNSDFVTKFDCIYKPKTCPSQRMQVRPIYCYPFVIIDLIFTVYICTVHS